MSNSVSVKVTKNLRISRIFEAINFFLNFSYPFQETSQYFCVYLRSLTLFQLSFVNVFSIPAVLVFHLLLTERLVFFLRDGVQITFSNNMNVFARKRASL